MELNREQILEADDLKTEEMEVPEWGGEIYIRTMTGTERDSFEQSILDSDRKANLKDIRAKLCSLTIVDAQGRRLFTNEDVQAIGGKSALVLDKIFAKSQALNGISQNDVEDLEKNSGETQSEDSTSD